MDRDTVPAEYLSEYMNCCCAFLAKLIAEHGSKYQADCPLYIAVNFQQLF